MPKLALFPLLLLAACLVAGVYGALHDQISYTVSPDYYHAFKFHQFRIPAEYQNRIGAAIVGWQATWWMGVFIGIPVLLIGLLIPGWKPYLTHSLIAFAVVTVTAMTVGLTALIWASFTITLAMVSDWPFPDSVMDKVAFVRAGTMHNFSYLGGFLGIITGSLYLLVVRNRSVLRGTASCSPGSTSSSPPSSKSPGPWGSSTRRGSPSSGQASWSSSA